MGLLKDNTKPACVIVSGGWGIPLSNYLWNERVLYIGSSSPQDNHASA